MKIGTEKIKKRIFLASFLWLFSLFSFSATPPTSAINRLKQEMTTRFAAPQPTQWGETVNGVMTHLNTEEKIIALTLDACGSQKGKGVDSKLIDFLVSEQIPATLFINARWIDANPDLFKQLSNNPLFEIANHGMWHKPASTTGRSIYGIQGTKNVAELVEEIALNAQKIELLTGKRPLFYRSGTAYYDEIAVEISQALGHQVIGFSILGDAGATYSAGQVKSALLSATAGDIIIAHMNHPESGTAEGIMAAIPELKRSGFRFARLSDVKLQ